ncbi:hypothetical protein ACHAPU_000358 [Fusarium lateritium]
MTRPPIPAWSSDPNSSAKTANAFGNRNSVPRQNPSLPISLSLSEDERSPNRSSAELHSPSSGIGYTTSGANRETSPADESADPLMPPVDAVYRPHVVHHTIMPPEMKAQQIKNKAKRYFASD